MQYTKEELIEKYKPAEIISIYSNYFQKIIGNTNKTDFSGRLFIEAPGMEQHGHSYWISFYKEGLLHREDGPARIYGNGFGVEDEDKDYFLYGELYEKKDYYKKLYEMKRISKEELVLEML